MPNPRIALYYAPALTDPLWTSAAAWLGRDPETNIRPTQPDLPDIAEITAEAALYGFHCTLKPPMRIAPGATYAQVVEETHRIAAGIPPFDLPPLAVTDLHGFLALTETVPSPALQAMSDACVAGLDHLRAPPTEAEMARRRRNGLPSAQEANLVRWGYPYVFATWFFHLTLTRRLTAAERSFWIPAAKSWFAEALVLPRRVTDICIFTQAEVGADFLLAERIPLG